jgi:hypothetical protein
LFSVLSPSYDGEFDHPENYVVKDPKEIADKDSKFITIDGEKPFLCFFFLLLFRLKIRSGDSLQASYL